MSKEASLKVKVTKLTYNPQDGRQYAPGETMVLTGAYAEHLGATVGKQPEADTPAPAPKTGPAEAVRRNAAANSGQE